MKYGYWAPVFGGWLRNTNDEPQASWEHLKGIVTRSEDLGYDLTLIAELNLNDIQGIQAPALDAWSSAAALAAITSTIELMVAVRPNFHQPALFAKQAANIDRISNGRLALNVVSSWWAKEAESYGLQFDQHDDRYARTTEWLQVLDRLWTDPSTDFAGDFYTLKDAIVEPKPVSTPERPRPVIYAGGESEAAKTLIARYCDAYVMHGDEPAVIADKIANMRRRREAFGLPPMQYGMAGYSIVRDSRAEAEAELARITTIPGLANGSPPAGFANFDQWLSGTQLERELKIREYSVSNRGLRPGFVGTPETVRERMDEFEAAGLDLVLLQMSPQAEEMERFSAQVIRPN
ncbi:FMNH(2)-dependent dimethylsulfone monooxygenase [Brevundimonas sp. NIBR10]|uniref:LLM class flavin-dependent oxidoreductase n=1 Tax=Brevundimonas sp. NIBR10 TaxID=3015997 RepID=UPI0022F1D0DC|nr:LLM class flavin-dependent oxidoreductase [Brevundimonas sp. NIBR10]WGM46481.1 FMNH(2)-dependent dimethylsulfone monooxygenase [Brevundimonas sp. NIBR10]